MLRDYGFKGFKRRNVGQGRHHPAEGIDLFLIQILHQLYRQQEQLPWYQMYCSSVFQGGNNLFQTGIKVKRCLIAEYSIFIEFQHFTEILDIIDHRPVAANYTLGHAGGAGSEYNVNGIGVDLTVTDRLQRRLINFTCGNFVVAVKQTNIIQLLGNRKSGIGSS